MPDDIANEFRLKIKKIFMPGETGKVRLASSLLKIMPQASPLTAILSRDGALSPIEEAMFAELGKRYNAALDAITNRPSSSLIDPYSLFMDAWDMAALLYDFGRLTLLNQKPASSVESEKTQAFSKELDENGFSAQAKKSLYIGVVVTGILVFAAALFPPIHPIISHHLLATTIAGAAAIVGTTFVISKFSDKLVGVVRGAVGFITNAIRKGKSILPRDKKGEQENAVAPSNENPQAANNVVKNEPKTHNLAEVVKSQYELINTTAKRGLKHVSNKKPLPEVEQKTGHVTRLEQQRAQQNSAKLGGKPETKTKLKLD